MRLIGPTFTLQATSHCSGFLLNAPQDGGRVSRILGRRGWEV